VLRPALLAGVALLAASPAWAGERGYSVTEFDRVDVVGPVAVIVTTGKGPSARATGTPGALDRVSVDVRSRRLVVRPLKNVWGGTAADANSPVTIRVTTFAVKDVFVSGVASVAVDKMKAQSLTIWASGAATATVGAVETDRLGLNQDGSGLIKVSGGKALIANISNKGTGQIDTRTMAVNDLTLTSTSSGPSAAMALRTAKITSFGQGPVAIAGPASCTINAPGGGPVSCGRKRP
jgi:hypothetical protein